MKINQNIFRAYDIRGIASEDLSDEFVASLGSALSHKIKKLGLKQVVVARDGRLSGARICSALIKSFLDNGINVKNVGMVPSPLLYFAVEKFNTNNGVMITGSHNPKEYNGFKIILGGKTIFGQEIQDIKNDILQGIPSKEIKKGNLEEIDILDDYINDDLTFKQNLHIGVSQDYLPDADIMDIAASVQEIATKFIFEYVSRAIWLTGESNLVYMGGVALNCVSNTKLYELCDNIWIMPNPGDAGNSLGAALIGAEIYDRNLPWPIRKEEMIKWKGPFLGTNIEGEYPVNKIVKELRENKICGVANGRAEFGPRALGNRSLLADPRGEDIKDKVNEIKKRQKFRPFAPAILEEHLQDYFDIPTKQSPYMQFVAKAKEMTIANFPAIVHADGTARVQSVSKEDNSGFRELLEEWYKKISCPMLLNTSLNIKGEPLVNTEQHAKDFENKYNVKVFTKE